MSWSVHGIGLVLLCHCPLLDGFYFLLLLGLWQSQTDYSRRRMRVSGGSWGEGSGREDLQELQGGLRVRVLGLGVGLKPIDTHVADHDKAGSHGLLFRGGD